jgi:hypothetical protein
MAKKYKNFIQNLKTMKLEDIDITADELNEDEHYINEDEDEQTKKITRKAKSIRRDRGRQRGEPDIS